MGCVESWRTNQEPGQGAGHFCTGQFALRTVSSGYTQGMNIIPWHRQDMLL